MLPLPSLRLLPAELQQPNYALYLSYPPPRPGKPAGKFTGHFDSKLHWGEVICGVNLGAPAVLEMRNAK